MQQRRAGRKGFAEGRQRYLCRACGALSFGQGRPPDPPPFPCPYCRGRCTRHGHHPGTGRQLYRCTACRRVNTLLWPDTPRSPGGPFRHTVGIGLSIPAQRGLTAYCLARGMSVPQAVRALFREAAVEPPPSWSVARRTIDRWGRPSASVESPAPRPAAPPTSEELRPLSHLTAETARQRMRRPDDGRYQHTVGVIAHITVRLDDLAKAGLVRTARRLNLNHQDAVRHLLANVHVSGETRARLDINNTQKR